MRNLWLVNLSMIELTLATGFMMIGYGSVAVFVAAMSAHSAYLAGKK